MNDRGWKTVDQRLRDRNKRDHRRYRKITRLLRRKAIQAKGFDRIDRVVDTVYRVCNRSWDACKEDATIKAALGAENAPRRRPKVAA